MSPSNKATATHPLLNCENRRSRKVDLGLSFRRRKQFVLLSLFLSLSIVRVTFLAVRHRHRRVWPALLSFERRKLEEDDNDVDDVEFTSSLFLLHGLPRGFHSGQASSVLFFPLILRLGSQFSPATLYAGKPPLNSLGH